MRSLLTKISFSISVSKICASQGVTFQILLTENAFLDFSK